MSGRVLVVTNDFPPVLGGIEVFAASLTAHLAAGRPPGSVTVLTRHASGDAAVDAVLPHAVVRLPVRALLPTAATARVVTRLVRETGAESVWFPSAAPLALLAGAARRAGARTVVASTHGHEVWWSGVPVARQVLRRVAGEVDALTAVSEDMRRRIAAALPAGDAAGLTLLRPGVAAERFAPGAAAGAGVRRGLGVGDSPVVLAVSRLVRRKGIDALLAGWPVVRHAVPEAHLVIVGDGPDRGRVARLAARAGGRRAGVRLVGARPWTEIPRWCAAADVFALPVRTRLAGLEPEAFGIAYLEAAASGLPVVAGRSGGTADALVDGETGRIVAGRDRNAVAGAVIGFLTEPDRGRAWGERGRAWVARHRTWEASGERLERLLAA